MFKFTDQNGQLTVLSDLDDIGTITLENDGRRRDPMIANPIRTYYLTTQDGSDSILLTENDLAPLVGGDKLIKVNDNMYINKNLGKHFKSGRYYREHGTFNFSSHGGTSAKMTIAEFEAGCEVLNEFKLLQKKFDGVKLAARKVEV